MKSLKILVLVHEHLIPPPKATPDEVLAAEWRAEYDVVRCLEELGHEVRVVGVVDKLEPIRQALAGSLADSLAGRGGFEGPPDLAFNLIESFDAVPHFDQNVVAYLELQKIKYTGCSARGLMLARDKALTKKLLAYHRIRVPDFAVVARGKTFRRPKRFALPLFVKTVGFDASVGISQASVVDSDEKLAERIRFIHESCGTPALVESYIEGRELYVGVLGNDRLTALPVWEMRFENMADGAHKIATERLKWNLDYQKRHGIVSGAAQDLPEGLGPKLQQLAKRICRVLYLTGYNRIDLRLTAAGQPYVIEANPNPQIARGEDLAEAANAAGLDYPALIRRILSHGLDWEPAEIS